MDKGVYGNHARAASAAYNSAVGLRTVSTNIESQRPVVKHASKLCDLGSQIIENKTNTANTYDMIAENFEARNDTEEPVEDNYKTDFSATGSFGDIRKNVNPDQNLNTDFARVYKKLQEVSQQIVHGLYLRETGQAGAISDHGVAGMASVLDQHQFSYIFSPYRRQHMVEEMVDLERSRGIVWRMEEAGLLYQLDMGSDKD